MDEDLNRRLGDIERRLGQIESRLGLRAGVQVAPKAEPPVVPRVPLEIAPVPLPPPMPVSNAWTQLASASPQPPVAPPSFSKPPPLPPVDLEHTIGLKWTGWVGAIVLIVGLALGYKFAYDQGWLRLAPIPKLILMVASGVVLLAAGEVVYRRINRVSAAGLFGAGVAVFFLSGYAGHAWYGLFDATTAILLMGAAALIGILVAARANLVSVAVLAIIGANVAPLVLGGDLTIDIRFLIYLACLQVMALVLCAWRAEPKWWALRGVTLVTTILWMMSLCTAPGAWDAADLLISFACGFWALFQGELLLSTIRATRRQNFSAPEQPVGIVFSLFATGAFACWVLMTLDQARPMTQGAWLVGIAVVLTAVAWPIAPYPPLKAFARGFRVQAVLLLILAVPVALQGPSLLVGWMLLAVGLAILAAVTRDGLAIAGAMIVWLLAVALWLLWAVDPDVDSSRRVWLTLIGQPLQARLCMAAALTLSGHLISVVMHQHRPDPKRSSPASVFGFLVDILSIAILGTALTCCTRPTFATWTLITYAWALLGLSYVGLLSHLLMAALVVLGLTTIKWLAMDLLMPRLDPHWQPGPGMPFLNARAAVGYVLAGSIGVIGWLAGRRSLDSQTPDLVRRTDQLFSIVFTLAMVALGIALSLEVDFASARHGIDVADLAVRTGLFQTILWAGEITVWVLTLRQALRTDGVLRAVLGLGTAAALILALKFVVIDVGTPYLNDRRPEMAVVLNLQVLTAVVIGAILCLTAGLDRTSRWAGYAAMMVPVLIWITGTAEIDRYAVLQHEGPVWIVRQVGWSIYWSLLAVVSLVVGFAVKWPGLRYWALALLAVTLLKVVLIDLSSAGTGWRILSFLGLGLLLLATSVLYGKFSKRPEPNLIPE